MTLALLLAGCAIAAPPLEERPHIVPSPARGELTIDTARKASVGNVTPVYVSIANGTDVPRSIVPSQIFAIDANRQPGHAAPA